MEEKIKEENLDSFVDKREFRQAIKDLKGIIFAFRQKIITIEKNLECYFGEIFDKQTEILEALWDSTREE